MATHAEAAEEASLIFVCVHREHYEFLTTLAPHLKGKVSIVTVELALGPNLCEGECATVRLCFSPV